MGDEPVIETEKKAISPINGVALGPGPGRPKGSKNKFTNLKDVFLEVFERLDGVDGLEMWAKENKRNRAMFYQWITKMLPSSLVGEQDDEGKFKPLIVNVSDNGKK